VGAGVQPAGGGAGSTLELRGVHTNHLSRGRLVAGIHFCDQGALPARCGRTGGHASDGKACSITPHSERPSWLTYGTLATLVARCILRACRAYDCHNSVYRQRHGLTVDVGCTVQEEGEMLKMPREAVALEVLQAAGSEINNALSNPFFGLL
jgi:hypothetical protein